MSDQSIIDVTLEQIDDYEFRVRFDDTGLADLITDEPSPLGHDAGPNPTRLLAAAVANCLSASLLFALRKYKNDPGRIVTHARATLERNAQGRLRVGRIAVELTIARAAGTLQHLDRLLAQFEDFCVVTESVRAGITVDVVVRDGNGMQLHPLVSAG
ncbi:MAG: OsmC family peroxiredoxin [Rhodanobacter sp.]|nr:MAG: OsmC family peroxiredoxin [Rhodanobacter sp.]